MELGFEPGQYDSETMLSLLLGLYCFLTKEGSIREHGKRETQRLKQGHRHVGRTGVFGTKQDRSWGKSRSSQDTLL